jgi:RecA/RadA recombinase
MARPKKDAEEKVKQTSEVKTLSAAAERAKKFLKEHSKNQYASTLESSLLSNVSDWISSGSLSLNKVLSGSYKKGYANNRLYVLAGPSSTGKSVLCAKAVAEAQKKGYQVFYFDSENAIDNEFMTRFGVKTDELIYHPVMTISEFRNTAVQQMKAWREDPATKDVPAFFFCDSIGGLIGTKEANDVEEGKSASDMGQRAKELRACARILTQNCAFFKIPMIVTNHTYEQAAANPQSAPITKMTGGEGFMYASSAVIYLKKRAVKEEEKNSVGDKVKVKKGNVLIATSEKNRFVPEGTKGEIYMDFERGISTYYGLLADACEFGFIEPRSTRFYVKHLDKMIFEKNLYNKEVFGPIIDDLSNKVEEKNKFATISTPIDEDAEPNEDDIGEAEIKD